MPNIVIPKGRIKDVLLEGGTPEKVAVWNFIKSQLVVPKMSCVVFKEPKYFKHSMAMAWYQDNSGIKTLCLNESMLTKDRNLHADDTELVVVLHEFSHFYHFNVNGGRYTQNGPYQNKVVVDTKLSDYTGAARFYTEREAWWLSLKLNGMFKLGLEDLIDKLNKTNMVKVLDDIGRLKIVHDDDE